MNLEPTLEKEANIYNAKVKEAFESCYTQYDVDEAIKNWAKGPLAKGAFTIAGTHSGRVHWNNGKCMYYLDTEANTYDVQAVTPVAMTPEEAEIRARNLRIQAKADKDALRRITAIMKREKKKKRERERRQLIAKKKKELAYCLKRAQRLSKELEKYNPKPITQERVITLGEL